MTGVERALQILQSGFAWSSAPYDNESYTTLMALAELSPSRRFQRKFGSELPDDGIPLIKWPTEVRHHAAQDSFVIIVQQLVADSMRLANLYMAKDKKPRPPKVHSTIELNAGSYARHIPYTPNCGVSKLFMKCDNRITHFTPPEDSDATTKLKNVRILAAHYNSAEQEFHVPCNDVGEFIFDMFKSLPKIVGLPRENNEEPNNVGDPTAVVPSIVNFCCSTQFPNLWLRLFKRICATAYARPIDRIKESQRLHLAFTRLAFDGVDIRHLQILQAIAAKPGEFLRCEVPHYESYTEVEHYAFDPIKIGKAIDEGIMSFENHMENAESKHQSENELLARSKYNSEIKHTRIQLIREVQRKWPCNRINPSSIQTQSAYLNMEMACSAINAHLRKWHNNLELKHFTDHIGIVFRSKLFPLSSISFTPHMEWKACEVGTQEFPKYSIDIEAKLCANYDQHVDDIATARRIFENGADEEGSLEQFWERFRKISTPPNETYLVDAQLYPRLVPTIILPRILPPRHDEPHRNVEQQYLIGALAVVTCREQCQLRIARYEQQSQMEVARIRERENPLHENWRPHEHPEWLLFEIEMGLGIRTMQVRLHYFHLRFSHLSLKIISFFVSSLWPQVKIAERMIQPLDNKHSVMQLNMGEGKTSVIVPIVAAALANGEQMCTVTVLRHLFQTNLR